VLEEPFLDISGRVSTQFLEQGLLGLAFHPNYAENGYFFVNYTDFRTNGKTFVVRYQVSDDDPNRADPGSAKVILTQDQPYVNHNGGTIRFGPDGYLYIGLGDGGLAGDPHRTAQAVDSLLGKMLRIDVDTDDDVPYAIPADNPFVEGQLMESDEANRLGQTGAYVPVAQPEIWALGLRNPWQFSFDRETGDLYIADVGQQLWEEINLEPADSPGGRNYGWPWLEGTQCFLETGEGCAEVGTLPVAEYNHADGGCSITGIGIYRGEAYPELAGIYFNSDYCTGKVWGLSQAGDGSWRYEELLDTGLLVTGAGEGEDGALYATSCECTFGRDYDPFANRAGAVWRIVPEGQVSDGAETAPIDAEAAETPDPESEDEDDPADVAEDREATPAADDAAGEGVDAANG
jgi:glucose/arabinose dehydrogenase